MSTSYFDLFSEELSDCCGAPMYSDIGMCSDCKEYSSSILSMEEAEREEFGEKIEIKTLSGLRQTAQYFIAKMENPMVGKYFDINSPIGF